MSQPVLVKVYGGFRPASHSLHDALQQIATKAHPSENANVVLVGDICSLSFEGICFPVPEALAAIEEHAETDMVGRLDVLDIENWNLCRHEINGRKITVHSQGLNNVLDYSGF